MMCVYFFRNLFNIGCAFCFILENTSWSDTVFGPSVLSNGVLTSLSSITTGLIVVFSLITLSKSSWAINTSLTKN